VLPVSGAYGRNKPLFNVKSDAVMDAVWNERGGWVAAHCDWNAAFEKTKTPTSDSRLPISGYDTHFLDAWLVYG
jgi:hypothetical protein